MEMQMAIKQLKIENFMKIEALDITPPEDIVILEGKNGAGKTSVHMGIVSALLGGREIPNDPIKHGKDHAMVEVDLGEQVVTLKITAKGTYLKVKDKATGKEIASPQKWLDERIGKIAFDPVAFLDEDPKKQRQIILDLVGINTEKLDNRYKEVFEERTIIGRDVKRLEGAWSSSTYSGEELPTEELNIVDLTNEIQGMMETMRGYNRLIEKQATYKEDIKSQQGKLDLLNEGLSNLETAIGEYGAVPSQSEVHALQLKITTAEETNSKIRDNRVLDKTREEMIEVQKNYEAKSSQLEAIANAKKKLLATAKLPIAGLEIADDCIKYKGNTIAQISSGEGIMVSAAIAKALNPTCKIMRVREWFRLDPDNQQIIRQMAKDEGYQVWSELVSGEQSQGIYIEDGKVR